MVTTYVSSVLILLAVSFFMLLFLWWKNLRLIMKRRFLRPRIDRDEFEFVNQIVEEERTRIAAELHDDLGSGLTIIHLNLEVIAHETSALTPLAQLKLDDARNALHEVLNAMRNSVWNLAAQMFDEMDVGSAIRELCRKHDNPRGARVTFIQTGAMPEIDKDFRLHLFRIVQELLVNCIRHSAARQIGVHIHFEGESISVTIDDDGVAYKKPRGRKGLGLLNISRRATYIGASLERERFFNGNRVAVFVRIA